MARPTTTTSDPTEAAVVVDAPPELDTPTETVIEVPADPDEPVLARWVDVQTVFATDQGIVRYGDPIWVSPEQLASPAHTTIPWSDDWTANPALLAQSRKVG